MLKQTEIKNNSLAKLEFKPNILKKMCRLQAELEQGGAGVSHIIFIFPICPSCYINSKINYEITILKFNKDVRKENSCDSTN